MQPNSNVLIFPFIDERKYVFRQLYSRNQGFIRKYSGKSGIPQILLDFYLARDYHLFSSFSMKSRALEYFPYNTIISVDLVVLSYVLLNSEVSL